MKICAENTHFGSDDTMTICDSSLDFDLVGSTRVAPLGGGTRMFSLYVPVVSGVLRRTPEIPVISGVSGDPRSLRGLRETPGDFGGLRQTPRDYMDFRGFRDFPEVSEDLRESPARNLTGDPP